MKEIFQDCLKFFQIDDGEYELFPITNSHINDTYRVMDAGGVNRYIIQRINAYVFPHPEQVMENVVRVTEHIRKKGCGETLTIIKTKDGENYKKVREDYIRMYAFLADGYSCDKVKDEREYMQVAKAIGSFLKLVGDMDARKLHATIPDFHNTPKRLEGFRRVVKEDPMHRVAKVLPEIEFILQREALARAYEGRADLPLRVTHNDTKPANVMLHKETGEALCMIDLDTVMPGILCDDFGDAIRSGCCMVAEELCGDAPNENVTGETRYFNERFYQAFHEGFLEACQDVLTKTEKELLPVGAMKITYEQALRFLEDYLKGDVYFKVSDEEQNLRRAKVHMRLLEEMEEKLQ